VSATLRAIAALGVLALVTLALLWLTGIIAAATAQDLAIKTVAVLVVVAIASLVLGWLTASRQPKDPS
jgi:hypothetical protein